MNTEEYIDRSIYYSDDGNEENNPGRTLYFITDGEFTKISIAYNAKKRLRQLQTGNPRRLKLIAAFRGAGVSEWDVHLRLRFKSLNVRGEWFRHTSEIDNLIKELEAEYGR